jgi:endonuclease G
MNKITPFLILLSLGSLFAAQTQCRNIYFDNNAPDVINTNIAQKTRELCYSEFAVLHSGVSRSPVYSSEHLFGSRLKNKVERTDDFHPEDRLPIEERSELSDYARSGYDRGHMSPARDFSTEQGEHECFTLANMIFQNHRSNTTLWADIEDATRRLAKSSGEIYVITGPLFLGNSIGTSKSGRVLIPTKIFKAIFDPKTGGAAAYLVDNEPGYDYQIISIDQLEKISGINVFPELTDYNKKTAMGLPEPKPRANTTHPAEYDSSGLREGGTVDAVKHNLGLAEKSMKWLYKKGF